MKSKRMGELAEQMFCIEVLKRGGIPCKPIGDSYSFDWVVVSGRRMLRVQIKSSWMLVLGRRGERNQNRCRISSAGGSSKKVTYKSSEVDVLAVWLDPFKSWVIKPISFVKGRLSICIRKSDLQNAGWDLLGLA
jgi:hypothetical protein